MSQSLPPTTPPAQGAASSVREAPRCTLYAAARGVQGMDHLVTAVWEYQRTPGVWQRVTPDEAQFLVRIPGGRAPDTYLASHELVTGTREGLVLRLPLTRAGNYEVTAQGWLDANGTRALIGEHTRVYAANNPNYTRFSR